VRKAAYEDAAKQFEVTPDESDPVFRPFLQDPGLWKGAAADSNVAAQQDGIAALCAFLKFGGRDACTRSESHAILGCPLLTCGAQDSRSGNKSPCRKRSPFNESSYEGFRPRSNSIIH